jgi:histidyl-tRNA synthetase
LPALGFGMGDVVLLELLKARRLLPGFTANLDAFCLIENESLREESLKLIHTLRENGLSVDYSLTPAKPDKQFKRAQELKAARTIKLESTGQGEVVAALRDLQTREEQRMAPSEVADTLNKQRLYDRR